MGPPADTNATRFHRGAARQPEQDQGHEGEISAAAPPDSARPLSLPALPPGPPPLPAPPGPPGPAGQDGTGAGRLGSSPAARRPGRRANAGQRPGGQRCPGQASAVERRDHSPATRARRPSRTGHGDQGAGAARRRRGQTRGSPPAPDTAGHRASDSRRRLPVRPVTVRDGWRRVPVRPVRVPVTAGRSVPVRPVRVPVTAGGSDPVRPVRVP